MTVLDICTFEDESIKNQGVIFRTTFSPWENSRSKGKWTVRSGPKSNSSEILWLSSLHASLTKCDQKLQSSEKHFSPVCHKTLCFRSPTQMMIQIKFDWDWPTGLRWAKNRIHSRIELIWYCTSHYSTSIKIKTNHKTDLTVSISICYWIDMQISKTLRLFHSLWCH